MPFLLFPAGIKDPQLQTAGLAEQAVWRLSNGTLAIAYSAVGVSTALGRRRMTRPDGSRLARWFMYSTVLVSGLIVVSQLVYAFGILSANGAFLFLLGLLYVLAMAGTNFWVLLMGSVQIRDR